MPKKKLISYPIVRTNRYGKVKVYECASPDGGKDRPMYVVVWRVGKFRHRKSFMDPVAADNFTDVVLKQFENGQALAETLTGADALCLSECRAKLQGVPLMVAVNFYLAHHGGAATISRPIAEVRDAFLADIKKQGNSDRDIENVTSHLKMFCEAVSMPMSAVKATDIDTFLQGKECSNRTRKNIRGSLCRFWAWARAKGHLDKAVDNAALQSSDYKPERAESPGIFAPAQLAALLEHIDEVWLPYLAISAWTGIRQAELRRLHWESINLPEKIIVLGAKDTKTNRRRVVHMPDNLVKWLTSIEADKRTGPICPSKKPNQATSQAAAAAGVRWTHNGLRHSYISYQMALLRDAAKVAEQCGNSPAEIQSSYKANTTESEAKKWFAIEPA